MYYYYTWHIFLEKGKMRIVQKGIKVELEIQLLLLSACLDNCCVDSIEVTVFSSPELVSL